MKIYSSDWSVSDNHVIHESQLLTILTPNLNLTSTHISVPLNAMSIMFRNFHIAPRDLCKKPLQDYTHCRSFTKFDSFGNSPIPASKQRFVSTFGTYPKDFLVGSTNVGIKPSGVSQPDLILVTSESKWETCGAAVLTKNEFPAASVVVTRDLLRKGRGKGLRGVIANSRCANLLTGDEGLEDSRKMSIEAGRFVSGDGNVEREDAVMVMHTGILLSQRIRSPLYFH